MLRNLELRAGDPLRSFSKVPNGVARDCNGCSPSGERIPVAIGSIKLRCSVRLED